MESKINNPLFIWEWKKTSHEMWIWMEAEYDKHFLKKIEELENHQEWFKKLFNLASSAYRKNKELEGENDLLLDQNDQLEKTLESLLKESVAEESVKNNYGENFSNNLKDSNNENIKKFFVLKDIYKISSWILLSLSLIVWWYEIWKNNSNEKILSEKSKIIKKDKSKDVVKNPIKIDKKIYKEIEEENIPPEIIEIKKEFKYPELEKEYWDSDKVKSSIRNLFSTKNKNLLKEEIIYVSKEEYLSIKEIYKNNIWKIPSINRLRLKIKNKDVTRYNDYLKNLKILFPWETVEESQKKMRKMILWMKDYENKNISFWILWPNTIKSLNN